MRTPISGKQNIWSNSQTVDDEDLSLEQDFNSLIQTSIINNHLGVGVVPEFLNQHTLFDSDLVIGLLDGKALFAQAQPNDNNSGNQLEVEVSDAYVSGNHTIKVLVIGLDFQNNLQYDRFTFHKTEKQYTSKHYTKILTILFNDFIGIPGQSLNFGGRVIIREVKSLNLARDCIMVSQDLQPNLFFRDFFVPNNQTIQLVLSNALPTYNISTLDIASGFLQLRELLANDISSQIGQKFQATTNNIQKITLLLSVINTVTPSDLNWTGDIIVSLYQLQSALDCPLDIAPNTAIDFDPSNIPLAQLTFNLGSLLAAGISLNETPQPVDFLFSNTPIANGAIIKPDSFYVITVKRAGSADKCSIQIATGVHRTANSQLTLFNGSIWVDVPEEDLWFQVWTDAAKVADGQAYDAGHGITIPKIDISTSTGAVEDFVLDKIPFTRNTTFYGVIKAVTQELDQAQDQRTGEPIFAHKQFAPEVSLLSPSDLIDLQQVLSPLVLGNITDQNIKFLDISALTSEFHEFGMIKNQFVIKVIDDVSDGYRYDTSIIGLVSEIVGGVGPNTNSLLNGKLTFNNSDPNTFYRIVNTELITLIYGDLDGNGVVDDNDIALMQDLLASDLNSIPSHDDYITLITPFVNDTGLTWQLIDPSGPTILDSGADGTLTVDPNDGSKAIFNSPTANFSIVPSLDTKVIKISNDISNPGDNGTFKITGLIDATDIDIQKAFYTSNTILQILQADINGDMIVDSSDLTLLLNYVNKVAPFPATTSPGNKIGTSFNALRFTLEKYVDRADDYTASSNRALDLHPSPDMLLDGYNNGFPVFGQNLKTSPLSFVINKQLEWYDYLVNATSNPKLVPASFDYASGFTQNDCTPSGITDGYYPIAPSFDPGRNDFFTPNNIVMNFGGELIRPDGYFYAVDFEVGSIVLDMPAMDGYEHSINLFTDFVADFTSDGHTRLGYNAMRFADCSFVSLDALQSNQIRFDVSVQSVSPNLASVDVDGYAGDIVDERLGVAIDYGTGILTLNFTNLFEDPVLQTRKTKVQIVAYLKKAGFKNNTLNFDSTKLKNLLGL